MISMDDNNKLNDYIHQMITDNGIDYVITNYQKIRDEYYNISENK